MNINNTACTCGVPFDKHGTSCGWDNARQDIAPPTAIANYDSAGYEQPDSKHYGLYQVCPLCNGNKFIPGSHYNPDGSVTLNPTCTICKGEGIIVRPEVKE